MLNTTEIQTITVSSAAAQAVKDILAERKLDGYALRVFVSGQSCCGMQFGMGLENIFRDTDQVIETEGIKLVVDDVSIQYLHGASIDFITDPERGTGFMVDSPNAKSHEGSCGDGGCGGGSCNCGH